MLIYRAVKFVSSTYSTHYLQSSDGLNIVHKISTNSNYEKTTAPSEREIENIFELIFTVKFVDYTKIFFQLNK